MRVDSNDYSVDPTAIGQALTGLPDSVRWLDVRGVDRLDSLGVLQLLRFARRRAGTSGNARACKADREFDFQRHL